MAHAASLVLGLIVLALAWPSTAAAQLVVAPGEGCPSVIRLIEPTRTRTFQAYDPLFLGGVSVAMGDVNRDGIADIITGAGATGGPHVAVFSGTDLSVLASFFAYDPTFTGGVQVAAGDVNGDGYADIITGPGYGGSSHIAVFSGADLSVLASFFAYDPLFVGGVQVAAGDVNGDGLADIITGAGRTGSPHVAVFSGADLSVLASFFAYNPAFTGGVYVAAGDLNGDGRADIITGPQPGGSPHVAVFSGADLGVLASFFAFDPVFLGGVSVATGDLNADGYVDLIMGSGQGAPPYVRIISGLDGSEIPSIFPPDLGCGVFVASVGDAAGLRFTSPATASFTVGTAGSFAVTTAGIPVPVLTVSGTLPTGITFVDNGNGTATLDGTPAAGTGGTHPLTFTANNGVDAPVTQPFTLMVMQPPAITSVNATTFTIGAAGSFTVTTTGFPVPTLAAGGVSLPAGVTFVDNGNGTATLSGTPGAGTGGTYALTFTAANGAGADLVQSFTLTVSGGPAITSANATTFTVGSVGTFTVTTIGTPTPALSVTGTLPSGVTFADNGDGTATLSGTPAASAGAIYPLTITATNGVLPNATQNFSLTISEGPVFTSASSTTFTIGSAGTFTVTTSGEPDVATITIGGAVLPAGVTFINNGDGTGTLSGTPGAGTGGTYALTFTANNGVGGDVVQNFTLTVSGGPAITSANATTFTVGSPGSFTVTTTGTPTPALSVSGALPSGVTFLDNGNGTGTLSGTPAAATGGAYALTFTAANGVLPNGTQAFTLNVNQAPAITSAASTTFTVGAAGLFTVTTSGFPLPAIARGGVALPSGVTFVDNGNGTGTLSGTPAAGTGGTYAITFTATNVVSATAPQAFTLTVNGPPAITSANTTTFTVGVAGSFTVTTTGFPTPAIARTGVALPTGVTFTDNGDGTGTLSGTSGAATGGSYALTFTASNGVLPDGTQAFTLNVNQAPAVTSAAATTFTVGTLGSFTVTTSGFPAPTLARGGVALPSGVTFTDNGNGTGTLSGTPAGGTGGTYAISFTATNTVGASAPQAFTLTVNQAPTITSANATTFTVGVAGSFTVTTTGFPGATIARTGVALPGGVTFVDNLNGTGTLSGTPAAGTGGAYAITFTAANSVTPDAVQPFTLNVNQAPAVTSAAATTFTVGTLGSFTVTTSGFPLPAIARGGVALPSGVTFVDNGNGTGTLSGTPAAATGGTYAISFTATNVVSASAPQAFTLTVNQAPAVTSTNTTTFTIGVAGTFTVTTTGFPASTITRAGVALPAGVTFVDNLNGTGTLSGTPGVGTAGSYAISFTAANGVPPDAVQPFTLNVHQAPAITSAASDTFIVGTPDSFTVTTTGFPVPTISQTGALPTGVTFTPGSNALAGTATQTGTFSTIQFTADNDVEPNAVQAFTLNVVCPTITVTPLVLPNGLYQTTYGPVDFNQTGSTGSTFVWSATGLLAGMTFDVNTGVVAGTPADTVAGGAVGITVTDNFGCTGTVNTTLTVRPVADNEIYNGGVGNTQYVVGVAPVPTTPNVLNADATNTNVKMGDNGPGPLTVTFPGTTTNGGTLVEGGTDGTFVYTPAVGFAGATDSFTYTLTDGNTVTNTATVTINLSGLVWYVNSSGGNGDGRSHNPFNTLASAVTPSLTNHVIYVHSGGATTPGNIALDASQTLHGQGATFNLSGLTITAGTRPTLTGTVTLANNTTVTAVNFTPSGIPALSATALTQPMSIDQVNVTGGTNALSLTNVNATVTVTNATFTNTSGAELLISGGTGQVNINLGVVISSNAGRSVDIQGRTTAGSAGVIISAPITDTGAGIFLDNNDTSTIMFRGGLSLSTTTNAAFTATNGGTVEVCDENPCNPAVTGALVNTITTTTGTALNVANTTIGAGGLTFRSISANGAPNGIVLNTTGTSGALTVTGDGTNTAVGGNGSGGTISNATGADNAIAGSAVYLNNTQNVSLSRMVINGTNQNYGIRGTLVNGFTLQYSTVSGTNGTAASLASPENYGEGSVHFGNSTTNGVVGAVTFTNNSISGGRARNVSIVNTAAGTTTLTIKGNTFGLTQNVSDGNASLAVEARVSSGVIINSTVGGPLAGEGNTFTGQPGDAANFTGQQNTTMDVVVRNNTISNSHAQNIIGGGSLNFSTAGTMTFNADSNTMRDANGSAVTFFKAQPLAGAATPSLSGRFTNNTIGVAGVADSGSKTGNGIFVSAGGTGTMAFTIQNNVIHQIRGNAHIYADNTGGSYTANFTITGNTLGTPGLPSWFAGIAVTNGSPTSSDTVSVCAKIGGSTAAERNTLNLGGNLGVIVASSGAGSGHSFNLPGLATFTEAGVENFIQGNNAGSFTTDAYEDPPATFSAFTGVGTACSTP